MPRDASSEMESPTRLTLSVSLPCCHFYFHEFCWVVFVWDYFAKSLAFCLLQKKQLSSWERRQVQVLRSLWTWSAEYPRDTFLEIKSSISKIHGRQVRIQGNPCHFMVLVQPHYCVHLTFFLEGSRLRWVFVKLALAAEYFCSYSEAPSMWWGWMEDFGGQVSGSYCLGKLWSPCLAERELYLIWRQLTQRNEGICILRGYESEEN